MPKSYDIVLLFIFIYLFIYLFLGVGSAHRVRILGFREPKSSSWFLFMCETRAVLIYFLELEWHLQ